MNTESEFKFKFKSNFKCCKCLQGIFHTDKELDRHNWIKHPNDEYQIEWSKHYHNGSLGNFSMGYQDDPYY